MNPRRYLHAARDDLAPQPTDAIPAAGAAVMRSHVCTRVLMFVCKRARKHTGRGVERDGQPKRGALGKPRESAESAVI